MKRKKRAQPLKIGGHVLPIDREDGVRLAAIAFILLAAIAFFLSGLWGGPSILGARVGY